MREHALKVVLTGEGADEVLGGYDIFKEDKIRRFSLRFDPEQGSILENVQASGVHAPYACKGGVCTTCRARVLSGTVAMKKNYGLTADEVAQGYVLTCQAVPSSDDVVLSYDVGNGIRVIKGNDIFATWPSLRDNLPLPKEPRPSAP